MHKHRVFLKDGSSIVISAHHASVGEGLVLYDEETDRGGMYYRGDGVAHIPGELYSHFVREDCLDEARP